MVMSLSLSLSLSFYFGDVDDDVRFSCDPRFLTTTLSVSSLSFSLSLCCRCNNLFFFCRFSSFLSKSLKSGFARNLFRVDGVDVLPVVSSREEKL